MHTNDHYYDDHNHYHIIAMITITITVLSQSSYTITMSITITFGTTITTAQSRHPAIRFLKLNEIKLS